MPSISLKTSSAQLNIRNRLIFIVLLIFGVFVDGANAQDVKVETVLEGLKGPFGVATQPQTGEIFVADTDNGRIIRLKEKQAVDVITGFTNKTGMPVGVCFLKRDYLVVGTSPAESGEPQILVYKIDDARDTALDASKFEGKPRSFKLGDNEQIGGSFSSLAKGNTGVFVCNNEDEHGWIGLAVFDEEMQPIELARKIETTKSSGMIGLASAVTSPQGYLAIGQHGELTKNDSQLVFYSEEGELLAKFPLDVSNLIAVDYSPKAGRMFALDIGTNEGGGLYKLVGTGDDRTKGCRCEKIVELDRPVAMSFHPDGDLYITVWASGKKEAGKLVRIKGLDIIAKKDKEEK